MQSPLLERPASGRYPWTEPLLPAHTVRADTARELFHFGLDRAFVCSGPTRPTVDARTWRAAAQVEAERARGVLVAAGVAIVPGVLLSRDTLPRRWHDDLFPGVVSGSDPRWLACSLRSPQDLRWLAEAVEALAPSSLRVQILAPVDDPAPLLRGASAVLAAAGVHPSRWALAGVDWRTWRWAASTGAWLMLSVGPGALRVDDALLLLDAAGPAVQSRVLWSATGARGVDVLAVPTLYERWLQRGLEPARAAAMAGRNARAWLGLERQEGGHEPSG